jgi:hypothetical protein
VHRIAVWQSHVRGQFPTQAEDALISLARLEAARANAADEAEGKIRESCACRRGRGVKPRTRRWAHRCRKGSHRGGQLRLDRRRRVFRGNIEAAGFNIQPINAQNSARDKEKFPISSGNTILGLRMRFEAGDVAGLVDESR